MEHDEQQRSEDREQMLAIEKRVHRTLKEWSQADEVFSYERVVDVWLSSESRAGTKFTSPAKGTLIRLLKQELPELDFDLEPSHLEGTETVGSLVIVVGRMFMSGLVRDEPYLCKAGHTLTRGPCPMHELGSRAQTRSVSPSV